MRDPAEYGLVEFVPQRAAARQRERAEQPFNDGQRTHDVAVVDPSTHVHEAFRVPVCLVDRVQTRRSVAAQRDQQLIAAELVGVVVQRDEHAVHQTDAMCGTSAVDQARIRWLLGACSPMMWRDEWMQLAEIEQARVEQFQIERWPGGRMRQ